MSEQEQNPVVDESEAQREPTAEPATDQAAPDAATLLEDARNKADEHWNLFLRTQAEMDNLRKRAEKDLANAHKYALEKFVGELLPVKDSLELGLAAANDSSDEAVAKLREGTELTIKMLSAVLEKFGVVEVNPVGETFDPEKHQAMAMQPSAEAKPNTVLAVMQKGYMLNDRLVRPSMVLVAKAPE